MTERTLRRRVGKGLVSSDDGATARCNDIASAGNPLQIDDSPDSVNRIPWCLYLIECCNGAYYAGITNKLDARYAAHVAGRGARYTRANPPLRLLGSRWFADRSAAAKAEWQIRQLARDRKLNFLCEGNDQVSTP